MKTEQMTIYLPDNLVGKIKKRADEVDRSMNWYIRKVLTEHFSSEPDKNVPSLRPQILTEGGI